ncbi:MAG: UvrD-helicase domain-containing protein [Actinomycetota bacterium]|nr:UvrD-helicase domain-containing protein [Actinomycetota bacterium]
MTPPDPLPPDHGARDRIRDDLGATLFVDAGAGSGKTSELVDRVVALVADGHVALDAIAAITFTEKAATELRDRIRRQLEGRIHDDGGDTEARCRCEAALDQLDGAAIGTLHAFARRILAGHAIEAGLPPRIEVLDEVSSGVAFEHRWTALRDRLLDDEDLAPALRLLFVLGVRVEAIRHLSAIFDDNWDLVDARVPGQPDPLPSVGDLAAPALATVEEVCREIGGCTSGTDKLVSRLGTIATWVAEVRALDDLELVAALDDKAATWPGFRVGNLGGKGAWPDLKGLQARVAQAGDALLQVRQQVGEACVRRLAVTLRHATLGAATDRRAAGRLEFHDLLVMARALLVDPAHGAEARSRLHGRYHRILLDEFQDTDPIQIELAVRIAAADPSSPAAGADPWAEVEVAPGRLFLVGDPKQSIYRFRRADISLFLAARDRYGVQGGGLVELTTNFRTVDPVIAWVNQTFGRLFGEGGTVETPVESQPAYLPLSAYRPSMPGGGPAVSVVGRDAEPFDLNAEGVRAAEAASVVATVRQVTAVGWQVADAEGGWRPARPGDITILIPTRTSLPYLEDELERAGLGFRAEASSLVYATRAIRDLLMVLRAVDDPTDHLRIVSALRTPLLGCGDDELYTFKVTQGGRWHYLADQPATVPGDSRVGAGLAYLRRLHLRRQWMAPAELADLVVRDRRGMELGFVERRARDVWRRLRWMIDQARAWSDVTGGTLRQYLAWVDQQNADGARVAEAVLPETDDDAVRIMTIHAAKGLEFPVTIVSGLSSVPQSRRAPADVVFRPDGQVGYRFGAKVKTLAWETWAPIDEQMSLDERIRLLYVACTRARDHLVVSLYRKERKTAPAAVTRTNAELLIDGMGATVDDLPDAGIAVPVPAGPPAGAPPVVSPLPFEQWRSIRTATLVAASQPVAVAATALSEEGIADGDDRDPAEEPDPGLQKRPRDLDLPPWLKGRYGTAVGRAVHGVLQVVDLATGTGLEDAVAAQCEAEAIPTRADTVARLVRAALTAPVIVEAARSPHWREVYAATPLGDGRLLEGYIDLLYRRGDGLVIVDYKTAATGDPDELDRRVDGYRMQGEAYRKAVGAATGEVIAEMVFVFLTTAGAVERALGL